MKMNKVAFFTLAALLPAALAVLHAGEPNTVLPGAPAQTYSNPILAGDYSDPSIVRVGQDFYLTHSSFTYTPGLLIWRSRDLVHWTPVTHALQKFHGSVWAPDIVYHKGQFSIYYFCIDREKNIRGTYVITAPRIEGPWSDPVKVKIAEGIDPGRLDIDRDIDPGHLTGQDGKRYLFMSGVSVAELAEDGQSIVGPLQRVYNGWPIPSDWRTEGLCLEGPKLLFKDDYYHLFSAEGGTAGPSTSHMVVEARSKSPFGPWENSPYNPIVHTSKRTDKWWSRGHGTVIDDGAGQWWVVYHAYNRELLTLGRQTLMEPIEWTKDGWARVPQGIDCAAPIPAPKLPNSPLPPLERSDDFSGPKLGLQWQFWKEYEPSRFTFRDKSLVLAGRGTRAGDSFPLTCMAGDEAYQLEVDVEIEGDAQAGLLLFFNPNWYVGLGINSEMLLAGANGALRDINKISSRRMLLRIVCDHNDVELWAGQDRSSMRKLYQSFNVSGYNHHTIGGFLSLRPALYCAGKGQAVFRNFRYTPIQ